MLGVYNMKRYYLADEFVAHLQDIYRDVRGEQETKNKLIEPLFKRLGYDIDCIDDVRTEVCCGTGIRQEKVDYILCMSGKPLVLVEAKDWKQKLRDTHTNQLFRYFCSTGCKLAILTNGIQYQFYSDFVKENIMDTTPFHIMNLFSLTDEDEILMKAICKVQQCTYNVEKYIVEEKVKRFIRDKEQLAKLLCNTIVKDTSMYDAVYTALQKTVC